MRNEVMGDKIEILKDKLQKLPVPDEKSIKKTYIFGTVINIIQILIVIATFLFVKIEINGKESDLLDYIVDAIKKSDNFMTFGISWMVILFSLVILVLIGLNVKCVFSEEKYKIKRKEYESCCYIWSFMNLMISSVFMFWCLLVAMLAGLVQLLNLLFYAIVMFAISLACFIAVFGNKLHRRHMCLAGLHNLGYSFEREDSREISNKNDNVKDLDLLLKYKKLYDSGAITKEEFERKKKELMK